MKVKKAVIAKPISQGEWLTTGDPLNWLKANIKFGLKNKQFSKDLYQFVWYNLRNYHGKGQRNIK